MKKIILVAAFVLGISAVSLAQGPPSPAERLAALKTSLSLNDAQVAKAKVIYDAQGKSQDSLIALMQGGGDPSTMFPKFIKTMETANTKIKTILTPEQAPVFQKQVDAEAEMMKRFQQGGN
jgi:hypothetical protein